MSLKTFSVSLGITLVFFFVKPSLLILFFGWPNVALSFPCDQTPDSAGSFNHRMVAHLVEADFFLFCHVSHVNFWPWPIKSPAFFRIVSCFVYPVINIDICFKTGGFFTHFWSMCTLFKGCWIIIKYIFTISIFLTTCFIYLITSQKIVVLLIDGFEFSV